MSYFWHASILIFILYILTVYLHVELVWKKVENPNMFFDKGM